MSASFDAVRVFLSARVRRMSSANPLWGAPRIRGELLKLGIEISQASVAKYTVRRRETPVTERRDPLNTPIAASSPTLLSGRSRGHGIRKTREWIVRNSGFPY
jgi:hypothetical protein